MILCRTTGFEWEEVYNWNVTEFTDVYHSLQRANARDVLQQFSCMQQAFGGDKKSITKWVDSVSSWLPSQEQNNGAKGVDAYVDWMKRDIKLVKK